MPTGRFVPRHNIREPCETREGREHELVDLRVVLCPNEKTSSSASRQINYGSLETREGRERELGKRRRSWPMRSGDIQKLFFSKAAVRSPGDTKGIESHGGTFEHGRRYHKTQAKSPREQETALHAAARPEGLDGIMRSCRARSSHVSLTPSPHMYPPPPLRIPRRQREIPSRMMN